MTRPLLKQWWWNYQYFPLFFYFSRLLILINPLILSSLILSSVMKGKETWKCPWFLCFSFRELDGVMVFPLFLDPQICVKYAHILLLNTIYNKSQAQFFQLFHFANPQLLKISNLLYAFPILYFSRQPFFFIFHNQQRT